MAFRRRLMRRRGRGRRRGRRTFGRGFAQKHRAGNGLPRPELKFFDTTEVGTSQLTRIATPGFMCLNNMQEGASAYQRIGRRVNLNSLLYRLSCSDYGTLTMPGQTNQIIYRLALVYDAQPNGSFPAAVDLFAIIPANGTPVYDILAPVNLNNRDRFLILKDKHFYQQFNAGAAVTTATTQLTTTMIPRMKGFVKLKGMETTYKGSVSLANVLGVAEITTGSLFFFFDCFTVGSAGGVRTQATVNFDIQTRLRYYD